jgi:maleate isomerase
MRFPVPTTDTLAARAKIGVVVPSTNTTVQPEYESMRPPGVTHHVTRMVLPPRPYDDMAAYRQALETEKGELDEALERVLECEPHVIAHGHSVHSFRGTIETAGAEVAKLEAFCERPFVTPSISVIKGLEAIGRPRRIGVLTPYWPPAGEMVANFFISAGYETVSVVNMQVKGPTNVAKIPYTDTLAAFARLDRPEVEAFVHVGTALPVTAITEQIESTYGKPLIGVNVATYWAALRAAGVNDRIRGFGRLLAAC